MTFSTLKALNSVITSAIEDIERVYRERSQDVDGALEFPSLDEPYYTTAQHTPEEELAESLKVDPAVATATMRIVAACSQLSKTVNKPWSGLMEDLLWTEFSSAIRFIEAANIVEILREAGPEGLHARDILPLVLELRTNSKTAGPPDTVPLTPSHLSHILRFLATGHYLREVKPDVFANNRASSYIDTGKTVTQLREAPDSKYNDTNGIAAYVGLGGDECHKTISCFTDWALPEARPSQRAGPPPPTPPSDSPAPIPAGTALTTTLAQDPAEGKDTEKGKVQPQTSGEGDTTARYVAPWNVAFDTPLGPWPWYELPGNEGRLVRFGHAMVGTRQCEVVHEILQGFSWEDLPEGSVLVDVGGGIGSQSILVAQAHPHMHVVVEDRAHVVSSAASAWGPQYAHLFESGRMSWRRRDFFEEWPVLELPALGRVEAPAIFLIRMILHDWKDADCKRILRRLRAAAGANTKLLIGDMLLQYACPVDDAEHAVKLPGESASKFDAEAKVSPLLPNFGVGNILGYTTDILMMNLFDAKERTVDEMAELTLSEGWKIVEVRRTPGSMWAYTTAVPV